MTLLRILARPLVALALLVAAAPSARAQAIVPTGFTDVGIEAGLVLPTALAFIPDPAPHTGRRLLFVQQFNGALRLLVDGELTATDPVGTVQGINISGSERGLLGVAVDPRWPEKPYVYMTYNSNASGNFLRISRFALTGDVAFNGAGDLSLDLASRFDLLTDVPDNAFNHNGGTLRFGPDSMLYASFGDDANSCAALDSTSLRGVILRLEVRTLPDGPGAASKNDLVASGNPFLSHPSINTRLVAVLGLRNPFRMHVDPLTRELVVADVGAGAWEEVSLLRSGQSGGWPLFEGFAGYTSCAGRSVSGHAQPLTVYDHGVGTSVISMDVYRAPAGGMYSFPAEYEGDIFFSDYYAGFIRRLSWNGTRLTEGTNSSPVMSVWGSGVNQIADALVGPDGAIWYCRQGINFGANTGQIRALRYTGPLVGVPAAGMTPLRLAAPSPNPTAGGARLAFTLPRAQHARLEMLDLQGRSVRVLVESQLQSGEHAMLWDGADANGRRVPTGLYLAKLSTGGDVRMARVSVMH